MKLVVRLDRLLKSIDKAEHDRAADVPMGGQKPHRARIEARCRYLDLRHRLEALDRLADRSEVPT